MYSTYRGNRFALFFLTFYLFAASFLAAILSFVAPMFQSSLLASLATTQLMLVFLPTVLYLIFVKLPVTKTLRLYPTKPINLLFSFLLALMCIPITMLINLLSQFFVQPVINDALIGLPAEPFVYSIITIAVFPALFEEMATRGIFLSHYRHTRIFTASLINGLFFGIIHLNINQFLYAFFLGALFSIVLHITGSIVCPMIMHFVVNGVNVALSYISAPSIISDVSTSPLIDTTLLEQREALFLALPGVLILVFITLPIFIALLYMMISINKKMTLLKENAISSHFFIHEKIFHPSEKQKIWTLPLLFTLSIFLSITIYFEFIL